jgi:hypothetical protein
VFDFDDPDRPTEVARVRNKVAARLLTRAVRELSTLPPLILLAGESPSPEQKALTLRHLSMSTPISESRINTLNRLNPTSHKHRAPPPARMPSFPLAGGSKQRDGILPNKRVGRG